MTDKQKVEKRLRECLKPDDKVEMHVLRPGFSGQTYWVYLCVSGRRPFPTVTNSRGWTNEILLQGARSRAGGEKAAARWLKWLHKEGIITPPPTQPVKKKSAKKAKS